MRKTDGKITHKTQVQNDTQSLWWRLFRSTGADVTSLGAQERSICLLEVNFLVTELMLFRESMSASLDTIYKGSFLWVDSLSLVSIFLGDLESRLCTTSAVLNTFVSVLSISSPVTLSTAGVLSIPIVPSPSIWFGSSISNSVNTKTDRQSANCSLKGITSIENLSSRVSGVHAETFRVPW